MLVCRGVDGRLCHRRVAATVRAGRHPATDGSAPADGIAALHVQVLQRAALSLVRHDDELRMLVRGDLVNSLKANAAGTGMAIFGLLFVPWSLACIIGKRYF